MLSTFLLFAGRLPLSGSPGGTPGAVLRWAIVISLSIVAARLAKRERRRLAWCGLCTLLAALAATAPAMPQAKSVSPIAIDYPDEGSVFPPDIAAPTFLWRDPDASAASWRIEYTLPGRKDKLEIVSSGARLQVGESDPECAGAVPPSLTAEQAAAHTWKPDAQIWEALKKGSIQAPVTIAIRGFRTPHDSQPVSLGRVTIATSKDPVGAPIFYRDVPLIVSPTEKGVIQPLPASAIHLVKWRLRDIAAPQSKVVMDNLPTCANCHSFSRDGRTLGLDVDGPQNDKGMYALIPVAKNMTIRNQDVIQWSSFQDREAGKSFAPAVKRFGFMSQVSPDGRYVVTTIEDPRTQAAHQTSGLVRGLADRFFNAGYNDYRFGQVFYPTRGILAYYSQETGKLRPLPGADDPRYVQASAFWSPDGKYLIFSRAEARDPYPPGHAAPTFANDPNETRIQYDLYRIPFNDGKGGVADRIAGASENGKSNNFPKVSPDGRWIVFVQCQNGLLMRPDSQLYIVPFAGGTARLLHSNTKLMNSWHSFSPNGRWLVFSSKARSPYTQMYLTHMDENGEDSPAILVENSTAANRAVNIPEFVNVPQDGIAKIDPQATEFYRLFDVATELGKKAQYQQAVATWNQALELSPDDAKAHNSLGVAMAATGRTAEAAAHYRKAMELEPDYADSYSNLGILYAQAGDLDHAIPLLQKALELSPWDAKAYSNLGNALASAGKIEESISYSRKAVQISPDDPEANANLGVGLARSGKLDEAIERFQKALAGAPDSAAIHANLGGALIEKGRLEEAVPHFEQALKSEPDSLPLNSAMGRLLAATGHFFEAIPYLEKAAGSGEPMLLGMLSAVYAQTGRIEDALRTARRGLQIATERHDNDLMAALEKSVKAYEAALQKRQ
jgi:tetratricopeptide (TPR) repeat protein